MKQDLETLCQQWLDEGDYDLVTDALEDQPKEKLSLALVKLYARALIEKSNTSFEDYDNYREAVKTLELHGAEAMEDPEFFFLMGEAYYYMDQNARAAEWYARAKALTEGVDDEGLSSLNKVCDERIDNSIQLLSFAHFLMPFRERVQATWRDFEAKESQLRAWLNAKDDSLAGRVVEEIDSALTIAFADLSFGVGIVEGRYTLMLSLGGDLTRFFELQYFLEQAPKGVIKDWDIKIGLPPKPWLPVVLEDESYPLDDADVWVRKAGANSFDIFVNSPSVNRLAKLDEQKANWVIRAMVERALGEKANMLFFDAYTRLDMPLDETPVKFANLSDKLKSLGADLSEEAQIRGLNKLSHYSSTPDKDKDADWRADTEEGDHACGILLAEYFQGDKDDSLKTLEVDGVSAGFLVIDYDDLEGKDKQAALQNVFDELKAAFDTPEGQACAKYLGTAKGLYYGYFDFMVWDMKGVCTIVTDYLRAHTLASLRYHGIRRLGSTVGFDREEVLAWDKEREEKANQKDDLFGVKPEDTVYSPERSEVFFKALEVLRDADAHSKSVEILREATRKYWNYDLAYALARAIENYAIVGDFNEEIPQEEADRLLEEAISVLEKVREEGQDRPEWNMRMAYGYQYWTGHAGEAIPYAQRWSELDPTDENGPMVIKECKALVQKENRRRGSRSKSLN